jgi:putative heme-binding domain-containing protein
MGLALLPWDSQYSIAWGADTPRDLARRDRLVVEAAIRLDGIDVNGNPKLKEAVRRHVDGLKDDAAFLKIVKQLNLEGMEDRLIGIALASGQSTLAVQAIDLAIKQRAMPKIRVLVQSSSQADQARALVKVLALSDRKDVGKLLADTLEVPNLDPQIRIDAALGLARNLDGQKLLIDLAQRKTLPAESRAVVGSSLRSSTHEEIKSAAQDLFPALKTAQSPLPGVQEMVKRKGNVEAGKQVFQGAATCSQCHMVAGQGKNVGPDLTEIGGKLSREAMYVSILEPSAGISHNYETYSALLEDDSVVQGLLVSQTDLAITIKDAKGIERTIPRKEVRELKKIEKSLMPDNLLETMTEEALVDLVEYLMTLRKTL